MLSYAGMIRDRYPDDPGGESCLRRRFLTARARLGGLVGEIPRLFARAATLPPQQDQLTVHPRFALTPEPVVLSIQEALSILRFPEFRQRTIDKDLSDNAVASVNRDKLVQVFLNLLRNALDATQPGGSLAMRVKV